MVKISYKDNREGSLALAIPYIEKRRLSVKDQKKQDPVGMRI